MLAFVGISSDGARAAVCGDADGDGTVTTSDGVRLLRAAADGSACPLDGCDLDGNGRVTVTDGVLALKRAAGLPIVDHCGTGTVTGRLLVLPLATTTSRQSEHEPNDDPGTAEVVGRIAPGEVRRLVGTIATDDPFDGYAFVTAAGITLDLALTFAAEPGIDLDLLVDDRHGGSATCESTRRGSERCRVTIGTTEPRAFDVVVAAAAGSRPAAYTLDVRATGAAAADGVVAGRGAGGALDLEPAVYRGEEAATLPGEIVMRVAPPAGAGGADPSSTTTQRALAAVVDPTGISAGIATEIVAPDGAMLLTLPASKESAVTTGAGPAMELTAKRARATVRARTRTVAATLAASLGVLTVQPNRLVRPARIPRDPLFPRQWHFHAIGLPAAWDVTIGSPNAIVAVIDTGIRSDHPDLAGRLVPGFDFISNATRANDGDGLDADPFDPGDRPGTTEGGSFHGTHVAGTIAASSDNTRGGAGVTWRTAIMPLRVLGVGGGSVFDVAQAIRFAAGLSNASGTVPPQRADVINLSLTTSGDDPVLRDAVAAAIDAGVLVVAAAGNTGQSGFLSPAGFPNVLSVAATDRLGAPARYSSFGPAVAIAAPGGDTHHDRDADGRPDGILSTLLPGREDYAIFQGTSMASAHVSGVAALLLGVPGGASGPRLRKLLVETADDRGAPGRDDHYGAGLIDAASAVRTFAGLAPPSEPQLALEAPSLRIAADESAPRVPLRNLGGGTLVVAAPTVVTDDGAPWLGATLDGPALRVAVDRDTLAPGFYSGRVRVISNGGAATLEVVAEVAAGPPEDLGLVTVLLRDPDANTIIATTTTDAHQDYRYRFEGVPSGRYEILATTDRDGDGAICDLGEECGAYPERAAPTAVDVFGGVTVLARDFGLTFVRFETDAPR